MKILSKYINMEFSFEDHFTTKLTEKMEHQSGIEFVRKNTLKIKN
jgi:hypothetical protein